MPTISTDLANAVWRIVNERHDRSPLLFSDALGPSAIAATSAGGSQSRMHASPNRIARTLGGAQFGQVAAGAEAGQRELGVFAGGDDQVHARRQVLDQEGERAIDRRGIDGVVVVEDDDDVLGDRGDLIEQGGQQRLGR